MVNKHMKKMLNSTPIQRRQVKTTLTVFLLVSKEQVLWENRQKTTLLNSGRDTISPTSMEISADISQKKKNPRIALPSENQIYHTYTFIY